MPPFYLGFEPENYRNFLVGLTTKIRLFSASEESNRPGQYVPALTGHKFSPEGYSETRFAGTGCPPSLFAIFCLGGTRLEAFLRSEPKRPRV